MSETLRADVSPQDGRARPGGVAVLVEALIVLLIVLPPLAMGAVAPWARASVHIVIFAAFGLWCINALVRGRLEFMRSRAWLFVALFLVAIAFQMVPLPARVLAWLSPGAAETYAEALPGGLAGSRTLSLFPYGTLTVLVRVVTLVMLFVLVIHVVRARWQVVGLLVALLAIGLFETLYGFGEHFSGRNHVFWNERARHLYAVTGTYLNKNHFAGLLEMIVPASLGLAFGLMPRNGGHGRLSARAAHLLSSGKWMASLCCLVIALFLCLGICFSVSRAGIACMAISFVAMAFLLGVSSGFRKYTLALLLLAMAVPMAAAAIGAEIVAQRFEPVIAGQSISWIDRLDLARSGVSMVARFPFFGTGAGSFEHAFERFQSIRVGDRIADYLHNDWLQLFCEYGLVGGGLLVAALVVLVATTLREALRIREPFWRWTSLGALCGAGALLVHSLFDYNLSKITANSVIFTMLLGVAFAGARHASREERATRSLASINIRFGPLPARILLAVIVAAGLGFLAVTQVREARADIACNRFLSQNPEIDADPYAFLPFESSVSQADSVLWLKRALRLQPGHPKYHYYLSLYRLREAEQFILRAARDRAASLISTGGGEENGDAVGRLAEALARQPRDFAEPRVVAFLNDAEEAMRQALRLQPVSARHNLLMAEIQTRKREMTEGTISKSAEENGEHYARRALWLAPTRPYVLQTSSIILLKLAAASGTKARLDRVWSETAVRLRRAIASDPERADGIYPTVWALFGEPAELFSVTPRNLKAYSRLARLFWEEQRWEEVLVCLAEMDEMVAVREEIPRVAPAASDAGEFPPAEAENVILGSLAYDRRTPTQIAGDISRRRCLALGMLGRWEARAREVSRRQTLLRKQWADELAEARRQEARRRHRDALRLCRRALLDDWSNPEALLIAARAAHELRLASRAPRWESALDQLYRLAIYNEDLSEEAQSQARELLAQISPDEDKERVLKRLILALLDLRAGRAETAEQGFLDLAADRSQAAVYWRQRHLIWHYLGRLAEGRDAPDEAIRCYRRTLEIVPTHRESLVRLAALGEDTSEQLAALTPDVVCNVNFGGKVTFVGYSLRPVSAANGGGEEEDTARWTMTYVWEFHDRMFEDYGAAVHFLDRDSRTLFQNDHKLYSEGRLYPVDFCVNGEVIVERRLQNVFSSTPALLRVAIMTFSPHDDLPRCMRLDQGGIYLTAALPGAR